MKPDPTTCTLLPTRADALMHLPSVSCKAHSIYCMHAGEASRGSNLQDILRLLTLWFSHGAAPDVEKALEEGFQHVSIDTWLVVIPQARSNNQRGCS